MVEGVVEMFKATGFDRCIIVESFEYFCYSFLFFFVREAIPAIFAVFIGTKTIEIFDIKLGGWVTFVHAIDVGIFTGDTEDFEGCLRIDCVDSGFYDIGGLFNHGLEFRIDGEPGGRIEEHFVAFVNKDIEFCVD